MAVTLTGGCRTRLHLDIHVNTMMQDWLMDVSELVSIEGYNFVTFCLNVCYCSHDIAIKIMWSDKADYEVSDNVTYVNKAVNSERVLHQFWCLNFGTSVRVVFY
jgi:hypothetical protein